MSREFEAQVIEGERGRVLVPVPFDPSRVWAKKARHHVGGSVNGMGVRGVIESVGSEFVLPLGAAWRRDCGLRPGDRVKVILQPEGPQRGDLAPDIAAALDAEPAAGEFFDSLAQFYRKAYLKWIESTKRSPELRRARISEVATLLKQGRKQRPGGGGV